jgi:hypothetical protein
VHTADPPPPGTRTGDHEQPPVGLTPLGVEQWHRRRRQEEHRQALLVERTAEYERAHREWEQLREHYRDNEPVNEVLCGHEPQLSEGAGWEIRSPVVFCDVDGYRADSGEWFGLWPCWTFELLNDRAAAEGDGDYSDMVNAPLSDAAIAALNARFTSGNVPRHTVRLREPEPPEGDDD